MLSPEEILEQIKKVSLSIGCTLYEREELTQIVSLKYLEHPQLFNKADKQKTYIYVVVKNTYSKLFSHSIASGSISNIEIKQEVTEPKQIDKVKLFKDMKKELNHMERMWIDQYIDCGFCYSEIEKRTGITRQKASNRIKEILDKWKHLDIYLD